MKDEDALKVILASLLIFEETQQLFSDEFWDEMDKFQVEGTLCTWLDISKFHERLKAFARQKGVQL